MLAKLGNVVYWLGCAAAVITIVSGFKSWFAEGSVDTLIFFWIIAGAAWLIGLVFRYVLRKVVW